MFGALGRAKYRTCLTFVSEYAFANGIKSVLGLEKEILPVKNCRSISKKQMLHNDALPDISVDPETYEVRVDGELLTCEAGQRAAPCPEIFSLLVSPPEKEVIDDDLDRSAGKFAGHGYPGKPH